jgi:lipopolysaccharide transport system ATP-binding protein
MFVRLAFSIVSSVDPDILIVDEALSVGDQHFQKKCVDRMNAFRDAGKTLVFCSHSMDLVRQLCEQTLWLKGGRLQMLGPTIEVIDSYLDYQRGLDRYTDPGSPQPPRPASRETFIGEVTLGGDCVNGCIDSDGRLEVTMTARLEPAARGNAHIALRIRRDDGVWCYGVTTQLDKEHLRQMREDLYGIKFVVARLPLLSGEYCVDVYLLDGAGIYRFDGNAGAAYFRVRQHTKEMGLTRLPHRWEDP